MNYEMRMPDLATTGSAIKIVRWLKAPGAPVQRGEFLLEIETDKSAMEIESPVWGILRETRVSAGGEVAGGDLIALLEVPSTATAPTASAPAPAPAPPAPAASASPAPKPPTSGGMFARNRAAKETTATAPTPAPVAVSPARRTAARRLTESKQTIPHFYLQSSARAAALISLREQSSPPLVWDAFFVQAASRALQQFDRLRYRYDDGALVRQERNSIGVAVDLDDELFVTPVADPAGKSAAQISSEIRAQVERLRAGDPASQRLMPGVMTISNLGSTGIESFIPIINPPEAAILAIGAIREVVVPHGAGFATEARVQLTLAVDHRVVNGRYAARFFAALVAELENPS